MSLNIIKIVNELNNSHSNNVSSSTTTKKVLIQRNRVLDQHSRDRRKRQQLAQLERDNFHDDPHANLVMHKKAPKFEDTINSNSSNRKSTSSMINKVKSLTFPVLVEDDLKVNPHVNYSNAVAPSPDNMWIANNELRCKFFNEWLINQSDKEPNENELDSNSNSNSNTNSDSDENELMDANLKNESKKVAKQENLNEKNLEQDSNSYKRILIVIKRNFCCVCGFQAPYSCITCGMRYCCSSCLKTHKDTRCLKWTV